MRVVRLAILLAPGLVLAQIPRVGVVDYYGLRKVPLARVERAAGIREGDRLPASKGDLEERLERVPGVVRALTEAVCCEGDSAILYVGIEERGAPHFEFRDPPAGAAALPENILDTYHKFLVALERAARSGHGDESIVKGHPLAADPAARAYQEQFQQIAAANLELLKQVLRQSQDGEQRAAAAYIIGYAPKKSAVVDDLQYAMQDADDGVRANAMQSLGAIAALGSRNADLGIRVEPTWFVQMLHSIIWSDRYRAAKALVGMTEQRNSTALAQLRERAVDALVEMARWKTLAHALPAFILTGRVAGLTDEQIQDAWTKGDREAVIQPALKVAGVTAAARPAK